MRHRAADIIGLNRHHSPAISVIVSVGAVAVAIVVVIVAVAPIAVPDAAP